MRHNPRASEASLVSLLQGDLLFLPGSWRTAESLAQLSLGFEHFLGMNLG